MSGVLLRVCAFVAVFQFHSVLPFTTSDELKFVHTKNIFTFISFTAGC